MKVGTVVAVVSAVVYGGRICIALLQVQDRMWKQMDGLKMVRIVVLLLAFAQFSSSQNDAMGHASFDWEGCKIDR